MKHVLLVSLTVISVVVQQAWANVSSKSKPSDTRKSKGSLFSDFFKKDCKTLFSYDDNSNYFDDVDRLNDYSARHEGSGRDLDRDFFNIGHRSKNMKVTRDEPHIKKHERAPHAKHEDKEAEPVGKKNDKPKEKDGGLFSDSNGGRDIKVTKDEPDIKQQDKKVEPLAKKNEKPEYKDGGLFSDQNGGKDMKVTKDEEQSNNDDDDGDDSR